MDLINFQSKAMPAATNGNHDANGHASETHLITADLLIPGRGEPIPDGAVLVQKKKILYAGPASSLPPSDGHALPPASTTHVPVVLPGLWDCHVHFFGSTRQSFREFTSTPLALAGARSAHDVAAVLDAGYTSVRELAGYGHEVAKAIDAGLLVGPSIYSAVSAISMTGGHVDAHDMSMHHYQDLICHGLPFFIADGVPECLKAVRSQLRKGARVIKICASGGVISDVDHPIHQQFSEAELKAMVDEAARADRIVAAHCHGKPGIMAALNAGVKTIEHGTYLDSETVALMKEKAAILVPTRTIIEAGLKLTSAWEPQSYAKLVDVGVAHKTAYASAIASGVKVALGSDLGLSILNNGFSHGRNGHELKYAVEAGLTPLQAIEAATATGPETLGPQAPKSGQLLEGYDADLIALSRNPLQDIEVFCESKNVTHVWKAGQLVKSPDIPVFPRVAAV